MKKIPVHYVRGGTSSGVIIQKKHLPHDREEINDIVRKIFGTPRFKEQKPDQYQIEGIGKGKSTSNKCFIIDINFNEKIVYSTFLQLENSSNHVSWDVNCGNMTTAIPLVLDDLGLLDMILEDKKIRIYNTNTKTQILCQLPKENNSYRSVRIPGVYNKYPEVDILFKNPFGSSTCGSFPTGKKTDLIDNINVTCIDAAIPMLIIRAESVGLSGRESILELLKMSDTLKKIEEIRIKAAILMKIKNGSGKIMSEHEIKESITTPKVSIVSSGSDDYDLSVIYLTPKEIHGSLAVSGGSGLSYACSINGTVSSDIFNGNKVRIKHFAGVSVFEVKENEGDVEIYTKRSAQIYMNGNFHIYED